MTGPRYTAVAARTRLPARSSDSSPGFPAWAARVLLGTAPGWQGTSSIWTCRFSVVSRGHPFPTAPWKAGRHEPEYRLGPPLLRARTPPSSGKVEASCPLEFGREGYPVTFLCRGVSAGLRLRASSGLLMSRLSLLLRLDVTGPVADGVTCDSNLTPASAWRLGSERAGPERTKPRSGYDSFRSALSPRPTDGQRLRRSTCAARMKGTDQCECLFTRLTCPVWSETSVVRRQVPGSGHTTQQTSVHPSWVLGLGPHCVPDPGCIQRLQVAAGDRKSVV